MVSTTPPAEKFVGVTNSDLAFSGKYAIQGSYNGFQVYDVSNPAKHQLDEHREPGDDGRRAQDREHGADAEIGIEPNRGD